MLGASCPRQRTNGKCDLLLMHLFKLFPLITKTAIFVYLISSLHDFKSIRTPLFFTQAIALPTGLDSGLPSYTLEEDISSERGGEFAGSLDGGGGSLGRTGFGPVSSSSTTSQSRSVLWCSLLASTGMATLRLRSSPHRHPGIMLSFLVFTLLVTVSTPFLYLQTALAHT